MAKLQLYLGNIVHAAKLPKFGCYEKIIASLLLE